MTDQTHPADETTSLDVSAFRRYGPVIFAAAVVLALFVYTYQPVFRSLRINWTLADSYYSHGPLVPIVSLVFAWLKRKEIRATPVKPSWAGILLIALGCFIFLAGSYLGFSVIMQLSILPMLAGFVVAFLGFRHLILLWFPLAFLIFMIPIPPSMTQSVSLKVKLLATEGAVQMSQFFGLPMVRDGSYIHFKDDFLLVGEVCGGLRSLIALLAFGAIMAYISKTRNWARAAILLMSGPVAVAANISRIFLLCVIGYFYGSEVAAGTVHDVSGILIFVVAFILMFLLEAIFRKIAPAREKSSEA